MCTMCGDNALKRLMTELLMPTMTLHPSVAIPMQFSIGMPSSAKNLVIASNMASPVPFARVIIPKKVVTIFDIFRL